MSETVFDKWNVKNFGAKGDGKTDDTAAIQKALDEAGKVDATVFIPEGVFVTGMLKMYTGTGLLGTPAWDYRGSRGSILQLNDSSPECLLDITHAYGVTITGVCFRGNLKRGDDPSNMPVTHGIMVDKENPGKQEDTPTIDGCKIEKFTGDGLHFNWIWCFTVRHSHLKSNGGCGMRLQGWDGFILDNWFSGNHGAGFGAYGANASVTMTGNRVEWNWEEGIISQGGAQYNITGNYIDRSGRHAIAIVPRDGKPCHHFAVTGNVMYRNGKPDRNTQSEYQNCHVLLKDAQGVVFTSNTMNAGQDDGQKGTFSPDRAMVLEGLENCVVKDNIMHAGAMKELLADLGKHKDGVVIKDNVGSLHDGKNPW